MIGTHVIYNGQLVPKEEANIPIDSIEAMYGFGVYESLKIRKGKLFFVDDHLNRFFDSAKLLLLLHSFEKGEIKKWIDDLIEKNEVESANIKIILLGGRTIEDVRLYIFLTNPLYVEKRDYRNGVKVVTFEYERFMPQVKSLNMLPSYIAYREAKEAGAYDALLIDRDGNIIEGTRTNFFAIKNKTLYTPPLEFVLNGVTRRTVIECAKENGYEVKEEMISLKNIFEFDGACVTSTSSKIVPIRMIDSESFDEIHEPLSELRKLYNIYLK